MCAGTGAAAHICLCLGLLYTSFSYQGVCLGLILDMTAKAGGRAAGERGPKRKLLWHVGRSTHVSPITRHHRDKEQAEHSYALGVVGCAWDLSVGVVG